MDQLERECRSYAQYLTGNEPSLYVIEKYRDAHQRCSALEGLKGDPFDQFLVETSARGPGWARLADSYASRFRKQSVLRRKLVTALAILECAAPSFEFLDRVDRGSTIGAILRLAFGAALYAVHVRVAVALFTPARVGIALRSRPAAVLEP
jgi:hypothetical protein